VGWDEQNVHICINVYGGLQYFAKCGFALRFLCFGFGFSPLAPKPLDIRAVCNGGETVMF